MNTPRTWWRSALACAVTAGVALGCADDLGRVLVDLEGPRGEVEAPGPWGVAVLTDGTAPTLFAARDGGGAAAGFEVVPLDAIGGGQFVGALPAAPVGAVIRYYAEAGGDALPPGGADAPRRVEVIARRVIADAAPPGTCALRFTRPADGARLSAAQDDNAPQAGVQITARVETDLPGGHAVRLRVGDVGYAGVVEQGVVAFAPVTLPAGEVTLVVDAVPPGGGMPCEAAVMVVVAP